ncbi:MAG: hypothetical protein AAF413_01900, partial [Patescibacteria group bacterium]
MKAKQHLKSAAIFMIVAGMMPLLFSVLKQNMLSASHQSSGNCSGVGSFENRGVVPVVFSPGAGSTVSPGDTINLTQSYHYCSASYRPSAIMVASVTLVNSGSTVCSSGATLSRGGSSHPFCGSYTVPAGASGTLTFRLNAAIDGLDGSGRLAGDPTASVSLNYTFNISGGSTPGGGDPDPGGGDDPCTFGGAACDDLVVNPTTNDVSCTNGVHVGNNFGIVAGLSSSLAFPGSGAYLFAQRPDGSRSLIGFVNNRVNNESFPANTTGSYRFELFRRRPNSTWPLAFTYSGHEYTAIGAAAVCSAVNAPVPDPTGSITSASCALGGIIRVTAQYSNTSSARIYIDGSAQSPFSVPNGGTWTSSSVFSPGNHTVQLRSGSTVLASRTVNCPEPIPEPSCTASVISSTVVFIGTAQTVEIQVVDDASTGRAMTIASASVSGRGSSATATGSGLARTASITPSTGGQGRYTANLSITWSGGGEVITCNTSNVWVASIPSCRMSVTGGEIARPISVGMNVAGNNTVAAGGTEVRLATSTNYT